MQQNYPNKIEGQKNLFQLVIFQCIIKKPDSLKLSIGAVSITSYWIEISFKKDKPKLSFIVVTDYDAYDGDSSYAFPIENYNLIINKIKFTKGDRIYCRISGETHDYQNEKVIFKADISHIIGKKMNDNKVMRGISDKRK